MNATGRRLNTPILVLAAIEAVLLLYFPPSLIFKSSLIAGGDTPSHFISAVAMRDIWSFFSPVTWIHGNFAGFPLFLQYFPLPFALMRLIAYISTIEAAFRLVTLFAIIPLPAAVYYSLGRLGYSGPVRALGAVFSLPFLVQSGNHMWGGNIASTLAGEFAYGISFILSIIYMAWIFSDAPKGKSLVKNSFIEALIAIGNGYPILQAGAGTGYFILRGGSFRYILVMHLLAFGLIGYWILPLLGFTAWNSAYAHSWAFQSPLELVPYLLWPSMAGAVIGLFQRIRRLFGPPRDEAAGPPNPGPQSPKNPEPYLWWQFGTALFLFAVAPRAGLVDVRFIPFAQIVLAMLGAIGWGGVISRLPRPNAWLGASAAAIIVFSVAGSSMVDSWIRYNYSGMDAKPLRHAFSETCRFLEGTPDSPRVVYEHSEVLNGAGTARAFELLPLFAGRSTLEGLYMQSSITAPYAFYMQSELSETPSTPLPDFFYSRFDPARLAAHMRLFNASEAISVTTNIDSGMDECDYFEPLLTLPPFRVYRLKDAEDSNVAPLRFQPFRISEKNWKRIQFEWFRKSSLQVPLIVASEGSPGEYWRTLPVFSGRVEDLPEIPIRPDGEEIQAEAVFSENMITVRTSSPGHPLWLKVSYHPSWRIARGGGELYQASPTFMLLVPGSPEAVLEFDTGRGIYLAGRILSLAALAVCIGMAGAAFLRKGGGSLSVPRPDNMRLVAQKRLKLFAPLIPVLSAAAIMVAVIAWSVYSRTDRDAQLLYNKANAKFELIRDIHTEASQGEAASKQVQRREDLVAECLALIDRAMREFPDSYVSDHCFFLKAFLVPDRMNGAQYRDMIEGYLKDHPDTRVLADLLFLAGESLMREDKSAEAGELYYRAAMVWPESNSSRNAASRLIEIYGPDAVGERASEFFQSGRYLGAHSLFRALTDSADQAVRDSAALSLAWCSFYMNRWQEASDLFMPWLNNHFESPESLEVQKALHQCNILLDQNKDWQNSPEGDMPDTVIGRILRLFRLD